MQAEDKMKTIIQLVQEKTGISEEQAKGAVETVAAYLKAKLPAPIAGQLEGLLSADVSGMTGQVEGLMGSLGGIFGGKKEG